MTARFRLLNEDYCTILRKVVARLMAGAWFSLPGRNVDECIAQLHWCNLPGRLKKFWRVIEPPAMVTDPAIGAGARK